MRRLIVILLVVLLPVVLYAFGSSRIMYEPPQSVVTERFGAVMVYPNRDATKSVLLLTGDSEAGDADVMDAIDQLRDLGALVFVVSADQYRSVLERDPSCVVAGAELERLNQSLQSNLGGTTFLLPVLVGVGAGADLAYVAHFHSPDRFTASLAYGTSGSALQNVCAPLGFEEAKGSYVPTAGKVTCNPDLLAIPASDADPKSVVCAQPRIPLRDAIKKVMDAVPDSAAQDSLIELPAGPGKPLALFFSGDGGWAGIDKETGGYLQEHGVNVVGWSSLYYFWKTKTPETVATDAFAVINELESRWQTGPVVLIGYSLGADAVPLIYKRLPASEQAKVVGVVMLAPEKNYDLTVHISDWIVEDPDNGTPLLPEVEGISPEKVLCIFGADDDDGVCPLLDRNKYTVVELPGGHHFDGEYQVVGEQIRQFLERRLSDGQSLEARHQ